MSSRFVKFNVGCKDEFSTTLPDDYQMKQQQRNITMSDEKNIYISGMDLGDQIAIAFPDHCEISDGYHTFDELYDHRHALFIALMISHPKFSWRANNHHDGSNLSGWFIAGMHLPTGDISYHMPTNLWKCLDNHGIRTSNKAPEWDYHTAKLVAMRLYDWIGLPTKAITETEEVERFFNGKKKEIIEKILIYYCKGEDCHKTFNKLIASLLKLFPLTGKIYKKWEYSGWGNAIYVIGEFIDTNKLLWLHGCMRDKPTIGDIVLVKVKDESIWKFLIVHTDHGDNPPDLISCKALFLEEEQPIKAVAKTEEQDDE